MVKKADRIFSGATAVITGGASGIGRALAEELAKCGSEVILADLQLELAEEVALSIQASGGKAKAVKLDVTDFSAVENLLQDTVERTGKLNFMFNNAGIFLGGRLASTLLRIGIGLSMLIFGVRSTGPMPHIE